MGWTFTRKEKGMSIKEFFQAEYSSFEVLDSVSSLHVAYLLCKRREDVFVVVCLLSHRSKDYYNFGYKDMDETMGPYYFECPDRFLDQLTPTESENALNWRANCRTRNEKLRQLSNGCIVRFKEPLLFENGQRLGTFLVKGKKTLEFRDGQGRQYRIPNWANREFEILSQEAAS